MKYTALPMQSSLTSKDVANELKSIEAVAKLHKMQMATFVDKNNLVALLLKDEHFKVSDKSPELFNLNLDRCWHRNCKKFHKHDRVLLVKSSQAKTGKVLQLVKPSNRSDWFRLKVPLNTRWLCKIVEEIRIFPEDEEYRSLFS